jgi:hypothetical protein
MSDDNWTKLIRIRKYIEVLKKEENRLINLLIPPSKTPTLSSKELKLQQRFRRRIKEENQDDSTH